jgi:hypothetical protein
MSSWSNKAKQPPKSYAAALNSSPESNMVSLKMSRKANKNVKSNMMLPSLPTSLDLPASSNSTNWAKAEPFVPAAILSQRKENAANMNSYLKEINMKRNLNQENAANMNSYLNEINNVRKNRKTRSANRKSSRKNKKTRRHH